MPTSPTSTTPNQGNIGTRSAVSGTAVKKPIHASQRVLNRSALKTAGRNMKAIATPIAAQSGARTSGKASSELSAMACSTPK